MKDKTKYEINLENWEFIENMSKEEYEKEGYKKQYKPSLRGKYRCKHCGVIKSIDNYGFKNKATKCECLKAKEGERAEGAWRNNMERWEFVSFPSGIGTSQSKGNLYKCKECGEEKFITTSNFKRKETVCGNGCHGVGNNKSFVIQGVNDLATTHPHLVKYFVNVDEVHTLKGKSNKVVKTQCPICKLEKEQTVANLTTKGFSCPSCSSGISYPERFVAILLGMLKVDYKTQASSNTFEWCGKKRYDFYIPSLNMIIETHGRQHYEEIGSFSNGTLEEEQLNDRHKKEMATANGIDKYIELDCRYSDFEWIKKTVLSSDLAKFFNLEAITWENLRKDIAMNDQYDKIKDCCDFYNTNRDIMGIRDMARKKEMSPTTFRKVLLDGAKLGLTEYEGKSTKKTRAINKTTGETFEFESVKSASETLGIERYLISFVLTNRMKSTGGYYFEYC